MGFLTKKMAWTNTEFISFKLSIAAAYLFIGASFPKFFSPYKWVIFGVFIISLITVLLIWIKKMRD
jgi:hypothetical protein